MNLAEKILMAYARGEEMPLKGHTKIILKNKKTGEEKVIESSNIITNAVATILAANWCGYAKYSDIFPLKQFYAGILGFQEEINESAENYAIPADTVNPLICHAGQEANSTASTLRGSPNFGEMEETDTSMRFVYDFSTNQGNGTIRTICLCPDITGRMGTKPFDNSMHPFMQYGTGSRTYDQTWSEDVSKQFPFTIDADGKGAMSLWIEGTTFKENYIRHDYLAHGIMRGPTDWQTIASRTATIRTVDSNCFVFDDASYYYVAKATSGTSLRIDKIAKSDMSVTQADITYTGASLYVGTLYNRPLNMRIFGYDGTYLYYPNSSANGFYKLNISNNADFLALDGTFEVPLGRPITNSAQQFIEPIVISPGFILGSSYIINGNAAYPIAEPVGIGASTESNNRTCTMTAKFKGVGGYMNQLQRSGSSSRWVEQGCLIHNFFLGSINVLEAAVVKTTAQTMKIIYDVVEVTT